MDSIIIISWGNATLPEVFNILLQILDDGRLTDAKGRVVNFKNTIIILTSNVGSMYIDKMENMGFSNEDSKKEESQYEDMKGKVLEALRDNFKP